MQNVQVALCVQKPKKCQVVLDFFTPRNLDNIVTGVNQMRQILPEFCSWITIPSLH